MSTNNLLSFPFHRDRDDIHTQLLLMKAHLDELSSSRADILQLETQRIIRSKQISLVGELEALGSAMSSHPLNTLSQRYAHCKKKKTAYNTLQALMREKVNELESALDDYRDFIGEFRQGKLAQFNQVDVEANYQMSEFFLIKDFLESSNQGALYVECEQLASELADNVRCQRQVLMEIIQIIEQYGAVVEFYPQNHIENHRLTKFPLWYRHLLETNNSNISLQQDKIKQIIDEFCSAYNRINEQDPSVGSIFFHLQTRSNELRYRRDVCLANLYQLENQTLDRTFDAVKQEFDEYIRQAGSNVESTLHELCKLNKRMLTVELHVFSSNREVLTDMMINDRWFLDEVGIQTNFLNNLIDVVTRDRQCESLDPLKKLLSILTETVMHFATALETFSLKVVPLTLKSIISEDRSTMSIIEKLSKISNPEIINLLYQDLVNPANEGCMRAMSIIQGYSEIVEECQHEHDESVGKSVFLSLHDLFEEITKNTFDIISMSYDVPTEWSNLIELEKARSLMTKLNPSTVVTLNHLFMAERVQTMIDFFTVCLETAFSLKGSGSMLNLDHNLLARPLKMFICNYYSKFILGRVSFCLSSTICSMYERKLTNSLSLDQIRMTTTSNKLIEKYFMQMEEKLRTEEFIYFTRQSVCQQSSFIECIDNLCNSYQWLHADTLQAMNPTSPTSRNSLLIQLQKNIQILSSWKASIAKIDEELQQCRVVLMQRLKWAAGANPVVNELMKNFETISTAKAHQLERDRKIVENVTRKCTAILNFEMMRFNTHVVVLSDDEFLSLLKQWEVACLALKNVVNTINPVEESLVELLDPEGSVDRDWIEKVMSLIDDIIHKLHGDIDTKERSAGHARDCLDMSAQKLRNFIATHHRISTDVKNLLKSILKHDEGEQMRALREYREKHKAFMEQITELHGNVLSKDFTDTLVKRTSQLVDESLDAIGAVYNDLFKFERTLQSNSTTVVQHTDEGRRFAALENFTADYPGSPMKKGI